MRRSGWGWVFVCLVLLAGCKREERATEPEPDIVAAPESEFSAEPLPAREERMEGAALFSELDPAEHGARLEEGEAAPVVTVEVVDVNGDWRNDLRIGTGSKSVVFVQSGEGLRFERQESGGDAPELDAGESEVWTLLQGASVWGADGVEIEVDRGTWSSGRGGFAVADFDGDGLDDVFCAGDAGTTHYRRMTREQGSRKVSNRLLLNRSRGRFHDLAWLGGLARGGDVAAAVAADFDLDGDADLFLANGTTGSSEPDLAFANVGPLKFEECGADWGVDVDGASAGAAAGDLDGDGDPELVVVAADGEVRIYRNEESGARRTVVRLVGEPGARVEIDAGGVVRETLAAEGAGELAFALGDAEMVARLEVFWADGRRQRFVDLAPDHRFTVRQKFAAKTGVDASREVAAGFTGVQFADLEPLIEREGSGASFVEVVDFDNDADLDLFVGGTAGKPDTLWRNDGAGSFAPVDCEALDDDAASVSADAAFFDADGDGDLDLYVVSGAGEYDWGDQRLLDRLYLGDGKGGFTHADADALPDTRDGGECVAVSDVDGDGDLDVFVGGGASPEQAALASFSRFYINETQPGGVVRFAKDFSEQSPGLGATGAVRDAVWGDVDGDGDRDLIAALEWGPVEVFENGGRAQLTDATEPWGLAEHRGWWGAVLGADFDGDGDLDLAAGNRGANSVYRATMREPALHYFSNDDERGVPAYFENGREFPFERRAEAVVAMPSLAARFPTVHDYAGATIPELYDEAWLASAVRLEATVLESGVWLNGGAEGFVFHPFPVEGQAGEVRGMIGRDLDGDEDVDLILEDGLGTVLLADGKGGFVAERWGARGVAPGMRERVMWDLNGDGVVDLVGLDEQGRVVWQRGEHR